MRDKTWGERLEDAMDTAANAVGLLSLIAVILTAVWAVTYCWVNHISVSDIGQTIKSFVDDGHGDEVGFVKAMRAEGYTESANDALDAGHKICSRLHSDGLTPTDVVNSRGGENHGERLQYAGLGDLTPALSAAVRTVSP